MRPELLYHEAKSEYAYAYDKETIHIILKTGKNDFSDVTLLYGDPFIWKNDTYQSTNWVHEEKPMIKRYQTTYFDYYFLAIKTPKYRVKYAFLLKSSEEHHIYGSKRLVKVNIDDTNEVYNLFNYFNFPYLNYEDLPQTPAWVKDTVWYQIFPDRFASHANQSTLKWGNLPVKNNELYGGNIKGIIDKLSYIKDLGINGIYFTPLFTAPSAHKYDTIDYFSIDPQFGTNEDFKLLVEKAHDLGIKVMLDGVFNHAGYHHPFFQDVIKNGEKSIYKNAFFIKSFPVINFPIKNNRPAINASENLNFETFALTPHMPKWHTGDKIAEDYLLNCVRYWIEEYKIDGWRLDVSNEISHDFLRAIKKTARLANPNTFILGENWDSSLPWLRGDQLDSVMNYDLSYPLWDYLEEKISLKTFKEVILNYLALTPKNTMENMFNVIGSHDTIRIKRRLKDDPRRVKLAYLFIFLSSGAPNIYYGDEIGLTGEHDPDNRRCMPWDSKDHDLDFKDFIEKSILLRKEHPSFMDYDYHFINQENVLCFTKKYNDDEVIVIMNDKNENTIKMPFSGSYKDLYTHEILILNNPIKLKPYQFYVLTKENV